MRVGTPAPRALTPMAVQDDPAIANLERQLVEAAQLLFAALPDGVKLELSFPQDVELAFNGPALTTSPQYGPRRAEVRIDYDRADPQPPGYQQLQHMQGGPPIQRVSIYGWIADQPVSELTVSRTEIAQGVPQYDPPF